MRRESILQHVKDEIASFTTVKAFEEDSSLKTELGISGDDDFVLVRYLEKRFGVKTNPSEWSNVYTVKDMVDVFYRCVGRNGAE